MFRLHGGTRGGDYKLLPLLPNFRVDFDVFLVDSREDKRHPRDSSSHVLLRCCIVTERTVFAYAEDGQVFLALREVGHLDHLENCLFANRTLKVGSLSGGTAHLLFTEKAEVVLFLDVDYELLGVFLKELCQASQALDWHHSSEACKKERDFVQKLARRKESLQ